MACHDPHSSSDSMTPSEASDDGDRSEHDSDYESDDDEDTRNVVLTGFGRKIPVVKFDAESVLNKLDRAKDIGQKYHMTFKMESADCRIVRSILTTHGFKEVHPSGEEYNIVWTGTQLKPFTLRNMSEFQKVNHFPRSYEITRKDRLYRNFQRMQQSKGIKYYDFVAQSFVLPADIQDFWSTFMKEKGLWIVKPVASSRGRGVYLVSHPEQVPADDNIIVSRYISNPLLVDGFKFDVRLYVAVTSYDPIIIYLYEEGLTRFATIKYNKQNRYINHQCMHLTNYSVNKKNKDYVKNDDPDVEDYGNKWSVGALLRYLKSIGYDTSLIMSRIESVVIKTVIAAEMPIATACRMFMPYRCNCFELYGFDILVDENLKPWVLEVNLSPSLACDSPLDLKIKTNMLCDLLSLAGLVCHDPLIKSSSPNKKVELKNIRSKSSTSRPSSANVNQRPQSAGSYKCRADRNLSKISSGLNSEEIKILRRLKEERERRGGWVCIFPNPDSWDQYGCLLQYNTTHNLMLHQRLYPERHKTILSTMHKPFGTQQQSVRGRSRLTVQASAKTKSENEETSQVELENRTKQYLRMLGQKKGRRKRRQARSFTTKAAVDQQEGKLIDEEGDDEEGKDEGAPPFSLSEPIVPLAPVPAEPSAPPASVKPPKCQPLKGQMATTVQKPTTQEESVDVVDLLHKGHSLTKVQARRAFSTYLTRVQQRLLSPHDHKSPNEVTVLNEQMDLVLRFLKRAAVNLQQAFKVVVPSQKLPSADRGRILAKQLGDFVHIYKKETEQIQGKLASDNGSHKGVDNIKFTRFTALASESELEEVLTTYTQIHKSASIFLGESHGRTDNRHQRSQSATRGQSNGEKHELTSPPLRKNLIRKQYAWGATPGSVGEMTQSNARLEKVVGVKPAEYYDEQAINDALHRLSTRQQARQYSAIKGCNQYADSEKDGVALLGPSLRLRSWSAGDVNNNWDIHDVAADARPLSPLKQPPATKDIPHADRRATNGGSDIRKPPVCPIKKTPVNANKDARSQQVKGRTSLGNRTTGANGANHSTKVSHKNRESRIRDARSSLQLKKHNWMQQLRATDVQGSAAAKRTTRGHAAKVDDGRNIAAAARPVGVHGERKQGNVSAARQLLLDRISGEKGGDESSKKDDAMARHKMLMDQSRALLQTSRRKHEVTLARVHAAQHAIFGHAASQSDGEVGRVYIPLPPPPRSK